MDGAQRHQREMEWVRRSRSGDHRAYRQLYETHVVRLYRFLAQFADDNNEVEDWVQRAFVKAYEHIGEFDERSAFGTWLFRIGLNEMRSDFRRNKIVRLEPESAAATVPVPDPSDDIASSHSVQTLLDSLDERKRSVFILHDVEGFSHAEIGSMLGIEESHSRALLTRTKSFLRQQLGEDRKAL